MFAWSRKESSSALDEALERIRALEEACDRLYRENEHLRSSHARIAAQAQKNRLDFVDAVQRADRLERKLIVAEARAYRQQSSDLTGEESREPWRSHDVSGSGSISDSGSFDPASYDADEGETAVDARPWDIRRGL